MASIVARPMAMSRIPNSRPAILASRSSAPSRPANTSAKILDVRRADAPTAIRPMAMLRAMRRSSIQPECLRGDRSAQKRRLRGRPVLQPLGDGLGSGRMLGGDPAHPPGLVVLDGLDDLVSRVHHKRPVPRDVLAD